MFPASHETKFGYSQTVRSRGSSVSVQRRATGWAAGVLFPAGATDFSLLHSVHTGFDTHPASNQVDIGGEAVEG
jgi:hypothetical protein